MASPQGPTRRRPPGTFPRRSDHQDPPVLRAAKPAPLTQDHRGAGRGQPAVHPRPEQDPRPRPGRPAGHAPGLTRSRATRRTRPARIDLTCANAGSRRSPPRRRIRPPTARTAARAADGPSPGTSSCTSSATASNAPSTRSRTGAALPSATTKSLKATRPDSNYAPASSGSGTRTTALITTPHTPSLAQSAQAVPAAPGGRDTQGPGFPDPRIPGSRNPRSTVLPGTLRIGSLFLWRSIRPVRARWMLIDHRAPLAAVAQPTLHGRLVVLSPPEPEVTYPNVVLWPGLNEPFQSALWTITACPL